jgi:hypothetical protein
MTHEDLMNWSNVDVRKMSDADLGNVEAGCIPYVQGDARTPDAATQDIPRQLLRKVQAEKRRRPFAP